MNFTDFSLAFGGRLVNL